MSIRYAIIENEFFAADSLRRLVSELRPSYSLLFVSESVEDTVSVLSSGTRPDLIFMDVDLVDGNCFDIISRVDIDVPVIFTTAYEEFAIKAFSVNSVDYLLKPLSKDMLRAALDKFDRFCIGNIRVPDYKAVADMAARSSRSRLLVTEGDSYIHVNVDEIDAGVSEEKYVVLVMRSGRKYITSFPNLGSLESRLDPERFFRLSRNLVVNISAIRSVKKYFGGRLKVTVRLGKSEENVLISAARKGAFLLWMGGGPAE